MKLLSIKDAANEVSVSGATIGRMIVEGALPAILVRAGRRKKIWRIRRESLEKWLAAKERETAAQVSGRKIIRMQKGESPKDGSDE